ncbi:MAG TPA: helix-turn-helix domain-containing protein [Streptosporangiaceae bacterium]|nr:helix-turn-helix domain-containing protein [Streptosporangiaceae bacterium]
MNISTHDDTIGERLRTFRQERALTQEELAERSGVSKDVIRKLEQNQRTSARIATLAALAKGLGVTPSALLGRRERIGRQSPDGILAVRDALLSAADLCPGIAPDDPGEPMPLPAVGAAVLRGWDCYWRGDLGELAAALPGLIGEARLAGRDGGAAACGPLAQAYQLAADLMVHTGNDDLAAVAAERALAAASRGDDELQAAVLAGTASWVLLHQGRHADAEAVARAAAERIEPRKMGTADPGRVTVYGALLLSAAAPAAALGGAPAVAGYMEAAAEAASLLPADRHDYWVSFGPTQVAMQRCYTSAVLGEPGAALEAAKGVRQADLLPISWGAHHLDVAQACVDAGRYRTATGALLTAHSVSSQWFRHQGAARSLVRELTERQRRLTPPLRSLAAAVGVR